MIVNITLEDLPNGNLDCRVICSEAITVETTSIAAKAAVLALDVFEKAIGKGEVQNA